MVRHHEPNDEEWAARPLVSARLRRSKRLAGHRKVINAILFGTRTEPPGVTRPSDTAP
ncbi:hypothetical protein J4H86_11740 [Spiractinospora alimapuensis]|uniref:hypothetical protein n=1 Tax=Spiractinospora alimapuensis TaxID=2820884 RepID=UPI001F1D7B4D|nr:hypothetical protein [Spiractinospora alimapuensis]QVQ54291.1 hypothetical protein J4H86_11740 [Spiractinospora alimapuensis]